MIQKFKFQKILDIKEKLEDNKKNEVAIASKDLRSIENELSSMESFKAKKQIELETMLSQGSSILNIKNMNGFIDNIDDKIKYLKKAFIECEIKFDQKKTEYMDIMKERKSFESLKEKHMIELKNYQKQQEDKFVDQMNSYRSRRIT
ncbi:flagellar FliJ protein [Peptoclostridium litorale DSM 5388]|uniref:Flagellar FliJ protein n=1 Tax=Peptoclostridium litorale DSM 5388 TaxID=1121324 RepID=A0A069REH4_PEPLI|nr:flagellar export protein FliJ [Peptoclostridium litorale]KDR95163.1 hypothetical protein CLIT_11c01920 [Peptoclostridium litorale DSM 5388]SIN74004.1 flagellar FliJ protein [Peptoclostridium litorale DSM 5388]